MDTVEKFLIIQTSFQQGCRLKLLDLQPSCFRRLLGLTTLQKVHLKGHTPASALLVMPRALQEAAEGNGALAAFCTQGTAGRNKTDVVCSLCAAAVWEALTCRKSWRRLEEHQTPK